MSCHMVHSSSHVARLASLRCYGTMYTYVQTYGALLDKEMTMPHNDEWDEDLEESRDDYHGILPEDRREIDSCHNLDEDE